MNFFDLNREAIGVFDNLWLYWLLVVPTLTTLRVWLLWLNSEPIRRVFVKLTSGRTYLCFSACRTREVGIYKTSDMPRRL